MNQMQAYTDVGQAHAPASAGSGLPHYSYGQPQSLQPASQPYPPASYGHYTYQNSMAPLQAGQPVTSSMGSQMMQQAHPVPTMGGCAPPGSANGQHLQQHTYDTTGQVAPPGMKPRVTATLWEDEGSLCFQVEANGVCVARREDNHMINGTKLLNVAGMTRGRRDGILKSEKTRHVVKIGPMHLKGVWIPFDRALDFANKEKITEHLYPLFVHNIGALLYHPTNQGRQSTNAVMAARRTDQQAEYMRTPQGTQPPALTHHHSMSNSIGGNVPQPQHSIAPHPATGRPGMDRAHTFPTPPTSASSLTMGMANSGSSYEYGGGQAAAMHSSASTPPGNSHQAMQYPSSQSYDQSRQIYPASSAYGQNTYQQYSHVQPSPSVKNEMAPPARAGAENEHADSKPHDGYGGHGGQHDAEGDHEGEYTHTSASNGARASAYSYKPNNGTPGPLHSEPTSSHNISPEMTHSPHQTGSGRATPRTTNSYAGYNNNTSQRAAQLPSSNLHNVMGADARAGAQQNGAETSYPAQAYQAPTYPSMNGVPPSNKRMREVDDQEDQYGRPLSAGGDKRQRLDGGAIANRPISQPKSVAAGGRR